MSPRERLAKATYYRYARHQNRCNDCRSGKDCGRGVILAVRWQAAAKAAGQIRETAA